MQDQFGQIQIYVRREDVGEDEYAGFKSLDIGDIIGVKGMAFRTKTGEISVHATEVTLLSKSLQPLPEKYHGLTNVDQRYRQRYVDLITNPESRDVFTKRSAIIREIRNFLDGTRLHGGRDTGSQHHLRRCYRKTVHYPSQYP